MSPCKATPYIFIIMGTAYGKNNTKTILVFNSRHKYIASFVSMGICAKNLHITKAAIYNTCTKKQITANGLYFRYLLNDMNVKELERLTLTDYDKLCNVNYKTHKKTMRLTKKTIRETMNKTRKEKQ